MMAPNRAYTKPSQPSAVLAKIKSRMVSINVVSCGIRAIFVRFFDKNKEEKNSMALSPMMSKIRKTCSIKSSFLRIV